MNAEDFRATYFTLRELTQSDTAKKNGITNLPKPEHIENLQMLCDEVLDPLRWLYGKPIMVNSGYRSPRLNSLVHGAKNSQHCRGQAADITTGDLDLNRKLLGLILAHTSRVNFDQCIAERCDNLGRPRWIHISWSEEPRRQVIYNYK